jgi:hypothetical protein
VHRLLSRFGHRTAWHRDSKIPKQLFGLIFVNVHLINAPKGVVRAIKAVDDGLYQSDL